MESEAAALLSEYIRIDTSNPPGNETAATKFWEAKFAQEGLEARLFALPCRGGVAFAGDQALLYQANLWLRTAVRVLQPILEAEVRTPDELICYKTAK